MGVESQDRTMWGARERALSNIVVNTPASAPGIRSEIQNSWRRCQMTGMTPATDDIPYSTDLPDDSRLRRAADPVVQWLAAQLSDSPATVLLADSNARIVDRLAGQRSIRAKLDNAHVAPGFQYAEDCTGTNGIGTALEERRLFSVRGGEHYREALQNLACVGKPIVHPIGRGVEGILDITCSVRHANALMTPLVEAAVREIEQRLYDMASRDEQALLEAFLRTSRRTNAAVITLSNDLVMANPAATRMLQPADQTLLWNWACLRLSSRDEFTGSVRLADSTEALAKVHRLGEGQRTRGIVVELRAKAIRPGTDEAPRPTTARRITSRPARAGITGRSKASRHLDRELDLVVQDAGPALITGEHGVGKTYAARALHARWSEAEAELVERDLALPSPRGGAIDWIQDLRDQLAAGATVLLRHADAIDGDSITSLVSMIEEANQQRWKLVLTGPDQAPELALRLYSHFRRRLAVASLSQRADEIKDIVREILAGSRPDRSPQRIQTAALQSLMGRTWPDNVRELESVVTSAATRALGGDIGLQHLPVGYREASPVKATSSLERAELDALLTALEQCAGNKSLAAKKLGVARSTLYRKVREYGIDMDRFVSA